MVELVSNKGHVYRVLYSKTGEVNKCGGPECCVRWPTAYLSIGGKVQGKLMQLEKASPGV